VANRTFFFDMAMPSLAMHRLFGLYNTTKFTSEILFVDLNTAEKSAGADSLCDFARPCSGADTQIYTASFFLPFARRAFKTIRPPLVCIRLRKPWVRWRFILLGWKVRFIDQNFFL